MPEKLSIFDEVQNEEKGRLVMKLNRKMITGYVILFIYTLFAVGSSIDSFTSEGSSFLDVLPGIIFLLAFILSFKWPFIVFLITASLTGSYITYAFTMIGYNALTYGSPGELTGLFIWFSILGLMTWLMFRSAFAAKKQKALFKELRNKNNPTDTDY